MVAYIANTTSKNHFLFSTFLMKDVYKDDLRNIAKDASSFAKANLMANTTTKKSLTYEKKLNKLKDLEVV